MKITKKELQKIIKEELARVLSSVGHILKEGPDPTQGTGNLQAALQGQLTALQEVHKSIAMAREELLSHNTAGAEYRTMSLALMQVAEAVDSLKGMCPDCQVTLQDN